jgi:hypothetical protein
MWCHTENCDGQNEEEIDQEELCQFETLALNLKISEIASPSIQYRNGYELNGGIKSHVFETAETGHQCSASLPEISIIMGHYLISCTTQLISKLRLVNGAATLASASDKLTPTSAAFSAPQSLAPSPQNPTQ